MADAAAILADWSDFPARAAQRPTVLTDAYVRIQGGFVDSIAKSAFLDGAIDFAVDVPDDVAARLHGGGHGSGGHHDGRRLTVTAIGPGEADFRTDRGAARLRCFELTMTGALSPVIVLDPSVALWSRGPTRDPHDSGDATVDETGLVLSVMAIGGVRTEFLGCDFVETDTAVLARPITRDRPPTTRPGDIQPGRFVLVSGSLARPLGGRVVVNEYGAPLTVVRATSPDRP